MWHEQFLNFLIIDRSKDKHPYLILTNKPSPCDVTNNMRSWWVLQSSPFFNHLFKNFFHPRCPIFYSYLFCIPSFIVSSSYFYSFFDLCWLHTRPMTVIMRAEGLFVYLYKNIKSWIFLLKKIFPCPPLPVYSPTHPAWATPRPPTWAWGDLVFIA